MNQCKQLMGGNQMLGMSECPFHAGGGCKSLACGGNGAHDEDAPIWQRLWSGTKITYIVAGTSRQEKATIVTCEGNCDHMVYEVRPFRARKTIKITGWAITDASGETWKK